MLSFWARGRRLLWSWWPWSLLFVWLMAKQEWWWALGSALMALFSYLVTPAAAPPRYGLDHEFSVDSEEFVQTVAGVQTTLFSAQDALASLKSLSSAGAADCSRASIVLPQSRLNAKLRSARPAIIFRWSRTTSS